jgi:hypothetical protein
MTKLISILAIFIAIGSVSVPALGAGEDGISPADSQPGESIATHPRDWRHGRLVCFARNIRGQVFEAYGSARTPTFLLRRRALAVCRQESFLLARTCRVIGCRRMGWER